MLDSSSSGDISDAGDQRQGVVTGPPGKIEHAGEETHHRSDW
jgi:hypothetical protein